MRFRRPILGFAVFLSILIAVGLLLPAVNSALRKWPELGCEFEDVDINTGRIRHTRYLLYCKMGENIEDSILTQTIGQFPDGLQPDWQHAFAFNLGSGHSHFTYYRAISQIRDVDLIWGAYHFSDEAKRHMAQTILDRWQSDGNYWGAGSYIRDVGNTVREKTESDPKAIISLADIISIRNE